MPPDFLILGCGYTAKRVAEKLALSGARVICTNRAAASIPGCQCIRLDAASPKNLADHLTPGMAILHSIPPEDTAEHTPALLDALRSSNPRRIVYISTTGIYGSSVLVNEKTPAAPETIKDKLRVKAENLIAAGTWSTLILRPAAIYGPGRGVHHSVQQGTFEIPADPHRIISRIHVDDLAELLITGLHCNLTGAFPVADDEPCPSIEVAAFTARLLNLASSQTPAPSSTHGRRVDGTAIRIALQVKLQYPSYRLGVPASIQSRPRSIHEN